MTYSFSFIFIHFQLRVAGTINYIHSLGDWIKTAESKTIISKNIKQLWETKEYREKQQVWFAQRGATLSEAARLALWHNNINLSNYHH